MAQAELKFRAWDCEHKDFIYFTIHDLIGEVSSTTERWSENLTIQRAVGIVDKHGVDIYEGDIIQHYAFPAGQTFLVEWNSREGAWDGHGVFHEWSYSAIIGNIFESPEVHYE